MSNSATPRLNLPLLAASQAQKHVTVNAAMTVLVALVQTVVESRSVATQPLSPVDGQMWLVPPSATGAAWAANPDKLLRYEAGAWTALTPAVGQVIYVRDEQRLIFRINTGWASSSASPGGLRNRLINGAFRIWQRGITVACPANQSTFAADRWQVWSAGAQTTAQQQTSALPASVTSALTSTGVAGLTSLSFSQTLEGAMIGDLAGQTATLSAWILASAPLSPNLNLYQYGQPDSSATRSLVSAVALGAVGPGWTFISQTMTLPPGVINGGQVEIGFGAVPPGVTVGIANAQLEAGPLASVLEVRLPGVELAQCQRFYQLISSGFGATGLWTGPASATLAAPLSIQMRATPSCALSGASVLTIDTTAGTSSTPSVSFRTAPGNVLILASNLSPARSAGAFAGLATQLALSAEL